MLNWIGFCPPPLMILLNVFSQWSFCVGKDFIPQVWKNGEILDTWGGYCCLCITLGRLLGARVCLPACVCLLLTLL